MGMTMTKTGSIAVLACVFVLCASADAGALKAQVQDEQEAEPSIALLDVENLHLSPEEYPLASGSTSAQPLGVYVACCITETPCVWTRARWALGSFQPDERKLYPVTDFEEAKRVTTGRRPDYVHRLTHPLLQRVRHHGTHGAYQRLIRGQVDLAFECRYPSEDERELMRNKEVELEITPIALDAFVFIVNVRSPINNLSLEQIRGIYTGEITSWDEVGGPETEIHAYTRNRNSGSQELMKSLVMEDLQIIEGQDLMTRTMMGPVSRLGSDPAGLGYSVHYYIRFMASRSEEDWHRDEERLRADWKERGVEPEEAEKRARKYIDNKQKQQIRMISVNGVEPDPQSIFEGKYPLVQPVYAVIRKGLPEGHPARRVRDWLLTEEGQRAISRTGYVPLKR